MWHSSPSPEIGTHVGRPLIGFRQNHSIGITRIDFLTKFLDDRMRSRKILATRTVTLNQIWDCVHTQSIDAHVQPITHNLDNFFDHPGIVKIRVRLVGKNDASNIAWLPDPRSSWIAPYR